jgi:hypothetical protein
MHAIRDFAVQDEDVNEARLSRVALVDPDLSASCGSPSVGDSHLFPAVVRGTSPRIALLESWRKRVLWAAILFHHQQMARLLYLCAQLCTYAAPSAHRMYSERLSVTRFLISFQFFSCIGCGCNASSATYLGCTYAGRRAAYSISSPRRAGHVHEERCALVSKEHVLWHLATILLRAKVGLCITPSVLKYKMF